MVCPSTVRIGRPSVAITTRSGRTSAPVDPGRHHAPGTPARLRRELGRIGADDGERDAVDQRQLLLHARPSTEPNPSR